MTPSHHQHHITQSQCVKKGDTGSNFCFFKPFKVCFPSSYLLPTQLPKEVSTLIATAGLPTSSISRYTQARGACDTCIPVACTFQSSLFHDPIPATHPSIFKTLWFHSSSSVLLHHKWAPSQPSYLDHLLLPPRTLPTRASDPRTCDTRSITPSDLIKQMTPSAIGTIAKPRAGARGRRRLRRVGVRGVVGRCWHDWGVGVQSQCGRAGFGERLRINLGLEPSFTTGNAVAGAAVALRVWCNVALCGWVGRCDGFGGWLGFGRIRLGRFTRSGFGFRSSFKSGILGSSLPWWTVRVLDLLMSGG